MAASSPTPRKRAPRKSTPTSAANTARVSEALGDGITFNYSGHEYTIPPSDTWDIEVSEALDDQKYTHVLRAVLGVDQYAEFRSRHSKLTELNEFIGAVMQAAGSPNS